MVEAEDTRPGPFVYTGALHYRTPGAHIPTKIHASDRQGPTPPSPRHPSSGLTNKKNTFPPPSSPTSKTPTPPSTTPPSPPTQPSPSPTSPSSTPSAPPAA
ncbi:hypothetical protein V502_05219 [Pseudogymnoascus sp. VKM F-4520 (FW-2644)]|nr:hypothetical protein V502_05219 [Pseudogymnoascus sp. VKM F-4520 (FW-2644)]